MEISPGIHQLRVPLPGTPLSYMNAYLVKTQEGCLLLDTGWNTEQTFATLARQIEEAGVTWSDLRYIAITHAHSDHYGLAGRLAEITGAKLIMHQIEQSYLLSRYVHYESALEQMDYWLQVNGVPEDLRSALRRYSVELLGRIAVAMPNVVVRGGEHLKLGEFDFEILWTPGHSPGHLCFYERSRRILFSGDHVLPKITPNVSMQTQDSGNPLADYLDSLRLVAGLPADLALPAHGNVFTGLCQRVEEIERHHEARQQVIVAACAGEWKTAYQIAATIPWLTGGISWPDLAAFLKRIAVTETLAHLEMLFADGILIKTVKEGIVCYASTGPGR